MTKTTDTTWRTVPRSGRAHLVRDGRPVCEAPVSQTVTWAKTTRAHFRCQDCRAIEQGTSVETLNVARRSEQSDREAAWQALQD